MGKHLNKVLGRGFKASKFKPLVTLSLSRLSVLKLHRQVRSTQARNDVVQLLHFGHRERALLRVEQVIKESNMMDAYAMLEGYCNLLSERADLIQDERECPEELKEAAATIIYAASRCGDFPELQEIRSIFASHFGREFAARAVELRNNCGVNVTMIMKLSTRQPSLENRMKALQEIATEHGISLNFEEDSSSSSSMQGTKPVATKADHEVQAQGADLYRLPEIFPDSVKATKFKDVADAAQAAFQSAAHAAAAARAAVELSRSSPQDPDNQVTADTQEMKPVEELTAQTESHKRVSSIDNPMEEGVTVEEVRRYVSISTSDVADAHVTESDGEEEEIMVMNTESEKESEDKEEVILSEKSTSKKEEKNEKSDEIELQNNSGELNSPLPAEEKMEQKHWFSFQKHNNLKLQAGGKAPQPAATSADQATSLRQKFGFKGKIFSGRTREVRGY